MKIHLRTAAAVTHFPLLLVSIYSIYSTLGLLTCFSPLRLLYVLCICVFLLCLFLIVCIDGASWLLSSARLSSGAGQARSASRQPESLQMRLPNWMTCHWRLPAHISSLHGFSAMRVQHGTTRYNCSKEMQIVNSTPMEKYKKCHSTLYAARIQDDCLPLEARSLIGSSGIPGYVACWFAEAPLSQKRIESWQPCPLEIDLG